MPCVAFEHTILASERGKAVHASDRSATVTGGDFDVVLLLCGGEPFYYVYEVPAVVRSGCVQECNWFATENELRSFLNVTGVCM
jgi:hypothetical protein